MKWEKGIMPRVEHEPVKLIKGSLCFTWDDEKAKVNIQKHGVSFYAAAGVFLTTMLL